MWARPEKGLQHIQEGISTVAKTLAAKVNQITLNPEARVRMSGS